ncbi:putative uncharacterized protein [Clostridium sp. CAG:470]|nr:putative uncharacterized protein [Clostridium sp. CAG:470]
MKVDIITRHSVPNYGSLLQSYATQKVIEEMGFESEIINYTRYEERYKNLVNTLIKGKKWDKNIITRIIYKMIQEPNYTKMYRKFEKYRKNFLKESKLEYGNLQELKDNIPEADVYCSGSDQIWGKIGTVEYDEAYFLKFIEDRTKRCIAYSSSFGKEEIDGSLEKNINKLLKNYSDILVREDTAKSILKKHGIENVEQVLDPTLLLNKEQWSNLANKVKNKQKKYILVYQLHDNKSFDKYAKEFSKKTGLKLLRISPSIYHITRSGKLIYLPNQYEFLSLFQNAEYVLTDSFHATVFSIIFNRKFVDILPGKTSARITSILKLTGLQDRILTKYDDFSFINKNIDFSECNTIIENERKRSIELLKKAIIGENNNTIDLLNKHYKCTGCRMCVQICPVKAIDMKENEEGFFEPIINKEKCIKCGLCFKRCPQLNDVKVGKKINSHKVFAMKNKNTEEQKNSSSGGVFSVLARYVLENNGAVYGACFDEKLKLEHIRIDKQENLYKLRGSKYLQSNTKNTFELVKNDLNKGVKVLYVGTPCQIAGLKNYLGKDYEELLLVDLVCHGVPSQKLFDKYLTWLKKKNNSSIIEYEFRSKEKKSWGLNLKVKFESGKERYIPANLDPYYKSFLNGSTYRECCYNCKYAKIERVGDITIADYWGIEKEHPDFYDKNGVSAVIINTNAGFKAFENIKDKVEYRDTEIEKIIAKNKNLQEPTIRNSIRNNAYKDIDRKKFINYSKKNLKFKKDIKDIIKNLIPIKIKKKIKKIIK